MKKNVGSVDRFVRFLLGLTFLLNIIILKPGVAGTVILAILGIAMLATSFFGYCSLYTLFKKSDEKEKEASEEK